MIEPVDADGVAEQYGVIFFFARGAVSARLAAELADRVATA
ncbi:hypothetical protein [Streptomyces sp. AM 2-1-1]|nr:hypothetical protein [Streptomyces sp. AM 2-1-1]WEH38085.1 hypothetical protein PZB77_00350 [Streptomyces sp. AM 2-1-1]